MLKKKSATKGGGVGGVSGQRGQLEKKIQGGGPQEVLEPNFLLGVDGAPKRNRTGVGGGNGHKRGGREEQGEWGRFSSGTFRPTRGESENK